MAFYIELGKESIYCSCYEAKVILPPRAKETEISFFLLFIHNQMSCTLIQSMSVELASDAQNCFCGGCRREGAAGVAGLPTGDDAGLAAATTSSW